MSDGKAAKIGRGPKIDLKVRLPALGPGTRIPKRRGDVDTCVVDENINALWRQIERLLPDQQSTLGLHQIDLHHLQAFRVAPEHRLCLRRAAAEMANDGCALVM